MLLEGSAETLNSQQRLMLALESANACTWEYDMLTGDISFARELGMMLGYDEGEIAPRIEAWRALTHPQDLHMVQDCMAKHCRGESSSLDVQYRIRAKNAEWRWLHTRGRVIARGEGGRAERMAGTHTDITMRHAAAEVAHLRELAVDAATNAILIVDMQKSDHPIVHVNPAFERITGYPASEVSGTNCRFLQRDDTDQPDLERVREAVREGRAVQALLRNYRKDGSLFWNDLRLSPVRDVAGNLTHFVGIQNDVTEIKAYQSQLEYQSRYDTLTGLPNRLLLAEELRRAIESDAPGFAVVHINLCRLKRVNDSLGRDAGDALMREVAARMRSEVPQSDVVARLDGDAFVVILHDLQGEAAAASTAQRLVSAIEQPIIVQDQEVFVSAYIGIVLYQREATTVETLLDNAERAMHCARQNESMQVRFYTDELSVGALESIRLEAELRKAITAGQFELHYQPRVELASGSVPSAEALVRWRHPERGLIPPVQFIPLAEETGLIIPLGQWVLREACRQMREWSDLGFKKMRVAVNLSPKQFAEPDLAASIFAVLEETGLSPHQLELEITESSAMRNPEATRKVLTQLSDAGIAIAIDDFGTGYSSLAYLKRFPIDYLKIDQSFIRGLPDDEDDCGIVRSIVALGQSLRVTLIAEGVETVEQRVFLQGLGCQQIQGYLFCRPQPGPEALKRLQA